MDDSPRQRSGGRAGRQALRAHSHIERQPFLTRKLAPVRGPRRGGPVAHRAQRRHDPPGGRPRVPGRSRCAAPVRRRRRRRPGRAGPLPARDVPPDRPGDGAARVHPVRPQPGQQRRDRRPEHRLRPELRLAVRARPGQRPALRDDRGLPQLREAGLLEPAHAPLRRDDLRAGRRARQQAPPGHGLQPHPLLGQAVHGLGHRARAGARHGRDGQARLRRRVRRQPRGDPQPDQRQLAARLGRDDARRGPGLRRDQPGHPDDAVHPGRGDGPGDGRRGLRPDAGRVARRDDVLPARPARRPGRPGLVRQLDVDAVRRARRSGRPSRPSSCTRWPAWPAGWASRSARAAACAPRRSPTPRPPTSRRRPSSRRSWPGSTSCSTPPAGWKAAWRSATRSSSSTPTSAE